MKDCKHIVSCGYHCATLVVVEWSQTIGIAYLAALDEWVLGANNTPFDGICVKIKDKNTIGRGYISFVRINSHKRSAVGCRNTIDSKDGILREENGMVCRVNYYDASSTHRTTLARVLILFGDYIESTVVESSKLRCTP